jgi:hypothetical protein
MGSSSPPIVAALYLDTEVKVLVHQALVDAFEYCTLHSTEICVITAWNPGDERPSDEANNAQNELLRQDLINLSLNPIAAVGTDPKSGHSEKSWAVQGLAVVDAMRLGAKYRQVAIFYINESRQTVHGCFGNWSVSRGNPMPIGMGQISAWINDKKNRDLLQEHMDRYFGKDGKYPGFEGRHFEWFIEQSSKHSFTAHDLAAIGALSVTVPTSTARNLIEDPSGKYAKLLKVCRRTAKRNSKVPKEKWLWSADSPFNVLFDELGKEHQVGTVIRSKLMAAKFPDLIPIRDSKVEALLEYKDVDLWWKPMSELLEVTKDRLTGLEIKPGISVTSLRRLDVVLWMEAGVRGL